MHHETLEKRELLAAEFGFEGGADLVSDAPAQWSYRLTDARPITISSQSPLLTFSSSGEGEMTNHPPTANDRSFTIAESSDAGTGPVFEFNRDQLIDGGIGEVANVASNSTDPADPASSEDGQTLRIVRFETAVGAVDEEDLPTGVGLETLTLRSDAGESLGTSPGGTFEFDFEDGIFTVGRFTLPDDYNSSFTAPVLPTESLIYVVGDDGMPNRRSTDDPDAPPAVITFIVTPTNDAPVFTIDAPDVDGVPTINVLEDDPSPEFVGFAFDISGGPLTALDEMVDNDPITFSFDPAKNATAFSSGLFVGQPTLSPEGTLSFQLTTDQIGSANLVVTATDSRSRTTDKAFAVNVRAVNDAPSFKSDLGIPISAQAGPDRQYSVARTDFDNDGQIDDATITYTLKEDNTQAAGATDEDFFIPLIADRGAGYRQFGLLDVFDVGPANESDGTTEGGSQVLRFLQAGNDPVSGDGRRTDRGGILTPVFDPNDPTIVIGLNYRPPTDFNFSFAGIDSFNYTVQDDSVPGGESFDLDSGVLEPDPQTSTNRVELVLNPVNDRPEFQTSTLEIDVQEDASLVQFESFATSISAGPPESAFDEVDAATGQLVEFTLLSLDFPQDQASTFFSAYPDIDEGNGLLSFRPAADIFGQYRFVVTLTDSERNGMQTDNTTRGDLISSVPVTLTINVRPVNDPPTVDPAADPLAFEIAEDASFEILVEGDGTSRGLLDVIVPGPSTGRTNEAAVDNSPTSPPIGAGQTVRLADPIPSSSAEGGSILFDESGPAPKLIYRPRPNFVGTDSFIYTVIDDGQTQRDDGTVFNDPRISSNVVTIEVTAVNDAPLFSGGGDVSSLEDAGDVVIENWAANVQAGPTTAVDEINGLGSVPAQNVEFKFNQISGDVGLIASGPTAVIDSATGIASLTYQNPDDANGFAVFEVFLEDDGPSNAGIGDETISQPIRTFTINVEAVNDPPTITSLNSTITIEEDNGPFSILQIDPIIAGPSDEQDQTVSFSIEPLAPEFARLFSVQPTISTTGVLQFTPAPNQNTDNVNGPVPIQVVATDSSGAETDPLTFSIIINEVDDAPRANSDLFSTDEDTLLTLSSDDLLPNDFDPDLDSNASEFIRVVVQESDRSVSGAEVIFDPASGQITYDPSKSDSLQALAPGQTLTDSFQYSLVDSTGFRSNVVTVAIDVSGVNDAPRLNEDTPALEQNGSTTIRPLDNDVDVDGDIDPASLQITLQPAFGALALQPGGSMIYTPFGSFSEVDVFRYTVADNLGLRSEEQLVTIGANASPIASDDSGGTFTSESLFIDVAGNDNDPDGTLDLDAITIVRAPQRGEAVVQGDGIVQYLPDSNFAGIDSFDYQIADSDGRFSNVATVTVQVVASRLRNPDRFSDVNADGFVTAIDALLIVNRLSGSGVSEIPVGPTDRGPNFFDVSGDKKISSMDALRVINELSQIDASANGANREQIVAPVVANQGDENEVDFEQNLISEASFEIGGKLKDRTVSETQINEVIDTIAIESVNRQSDGGYDTIDDVLASLPSYLRH